MIEKEEIAKKNINKSAVEMLKRMVDLENKDDRFALFEEIGMLVLINQFLRIT